ncbi:MAG: EamA family transporter, partial [Alphaproteobacteria bacterium]|nr:EamA family transporter [Alphaproteobacteria bacterium]
PMAPLWILFTLAAAVLQILRTALQRQLVGRLSTVGATYARYLFGAPLAAAFVAGAALATGEAVPAPGWRFRGFCALAGLCQIVGTVLLLEAFKLRNFAVGTAYSKTEAILAALFATVFLGETLPGLAWAGIAVSLGGVFVLSVPALPASGGRRSASVRWAEMLGPAATVGLLSGVAFAATAIGIRGASQSLGDAGFALRALTTLAGSSAVQVVAMTLYLALRDRAQFAAVARHWRPAAVVGVGSVLGSVCWFAAMTLETPAKVLALGQIELPLAILVSRRAFGERVTAAEIAGIALIGLGIVVLLSGR